MSNVENLQYGISRLDNGRAVETLDVEPSVMARFSELLGTYSLDGIHPTDRLFIECAPGALNIGKLLANMARKNGADFHLRVDDPIHQARQLIGMSPDKVQEIAEERSTSFLKLAEWANKVAYIRMNEELTPFDRLPAEVRKTWLQSKGRDLRWVANNKRRMLTCLPTHAEAKHDRVPYNQYLQEFWDAVFIDYEATDKSLMALKHILDRADILRFVAQDPYNRSEWDTDLSMSIKGMYGAPSSAKVNVPGLEWFTGPVDGTMEGTYAIPYPLLFNGKMLPNLRLVFEKGKVKTYEVIGKDAVETNTLMKFLDTFFTDDPGARKPGEAAIGCNRNITRLSIDPLRMEKPAGTVHIALGSAYQMLEYCGLPVNVDNGNKANNHIDLVRSLYGEQGEGAIYVDGDIIQVNGVFRSGLGLESLNVQQ